MKISAKVLADSLAPCGARLTTMEWTYPRFIHSEIMTHRGLSKNAASSRAIPVDKMLQRVLDHPVIPKVWGSNQKGMQAGAEVDDTTKQLAREKWLLQRSHAVGTANDLAALGLHKQIVNRLVEPWMWITIIVSATDWDNVWGLRCHEAAEPHFQELAYKARDALRASTPDKLPAGGWHLPLITPSDVNEVAAKLADESDLTGAAFKNAVNAVLLKVSVGRCARVSYLTHAGKRDLQADVDLHDRLVVQQPAHASPAEHVAQARDWPEWFRTNHNCFGATDVYALRNTVVFERRGRQEVEERDRRWIAPFPVELHGGAALGELTSGNFIGFHQYRKTLKHEHIGGLMP